MCRASTGTRSRVGRISSSPGRSASASRTPRAARALAPEELDCVLVPGLAFDARGTRLGRGGGYYDAALTQFDVGTPRIGIMFACQQAPEVPRDAHDQTTDLVVTENGMVRGGLTIQKREDVRAAAAVAYSLMLAL